VEKSSIWFQPQSISNILTKTFYLYFYIVVAALAVLAVLAEVALASSKALLS